MKDRKHLHPLWGKKPLATQMQREHGSAVGEGVRVEVLCFSTDDEV